MAVTDARRLALFDHARTACGEDAALALMDMLPSDRDELATKQDLRELGLAVRAEMAELRSGLRAEIAGLRAEVHQGFASQTPR